MYICRNGLRKPYWRLHFVILRDNKLVDYRSIPDINTAALGTALTAAGPAPAGSGSLMVAVNLATNVNIRQVMPMDVAMTIYFRTTLQTGDEVDILERARILYTNHQNEEVKAGKN